MSLTELAKNQSYWPNGVRIVTTHISCGLNLLQPVSNWYHGLEPEEFLFRLVFISKHKDKFKRPEAKLFDKDTILYNPIPPKEHFVLDTRHGYVVSSQALWLTRLKTVITKLNLGVYYDTPAFPNKHYIADNEDPGIGLMVWFWNGKVPNIKDLSFDCPYNDKGELKNV